MAAEDFHLRDIHRRILAQDNGGRSLYNATNPFPVTDPGFDDQKFFNSTFEEKKLENSNFFLSFP
jgi:hypothetical protein